MSRWDRCIEDGCDQPTEHDRCEDCQATHQKQRPAKRKDAEGSKAWDSH